MNIELQSMFYEVKEILKPTKAMWWGKLKVGDVVTFRMIVKNRGGARNGNYATDITCVNIVNDTRHTYSEKQVANYSEQFVLSTNISQP